MARLWVWAALAVAVAFAASARAQDDQCAVEGACRYTESVTVPWNGRMETLLVEQQMPWVIQNNLTLYPGDSAVISLPIDQEGQLPVSLVATGEAAKARVLQPGEVRFEFTLGPMDGMMLQAQSAHPRWLHYMAVMTLPDSTGQKTSICPIRSGAMGIEMWQHGIVMLALTNFTPEPESDTATCR